MLHPAGCPASGNRPLFLIAAWNDATPSWLSCSGNRPLFLIAAWNDAFSLRRVTESPCGHDRVVGAGAGTKRDSISDIPVSHSASIVHRGLGRYCPNITGG